ncbi:DMT family transporter [Tissierella sp. MB52-C2]|uniref:DMT family transporter n=1 Tax=Tissierella sp. MB52-C2 TaxID=3070999 RepID=UPI00280A7FDF|nr:DMT family transporter [Tissierella sp. MB52-C2]WMM25914.1 DMT family transporter [Tissierella sp. MB52-C2]
MNIKKDRYKGIILAAIASTMWSTGGIFVKLVDWNPISIAGLRSFIAALVMLIYIKKPKFTKSKPQILGTITTCTTMLCFIIANKLTTSANAILLQYTAPIFVAILGVWILKEKIRWYDILSITVVFLGMILFFIDNVNIGNTLGNIIAILSGFSLACMTISLRLQKDGSAMDTTFFGNMLTFIIAIPFFIFTPLPDVKSIIIIIIMGVFQLGIPYIFYVNSTKYLTALEAILITVIEPLLNPLWVYVFAGENPGIYAIIGGVVVIAAVLIRGIYVSKLESIEEQGIK